MSSILAQYIRSSVLSSLSTSIVTGHLIIVDNANSVSDAFHFGQEAAPGITLVINDNHFWLRLLLSGTIALGEAYMAGEVDIKDGDLEKIMLVRTHSLPPFFSLSLSSNINYSAMARQQTNDVLRTHHHCHTGLVYDVQPFHLILRAIQEERAAKCDHVL